MKTKKKQIHLSDLGEFVFSTDTNFKDSSNKNIETIPNNKQHLEAHFSNKGRGGKTVTIIKGFQGSTEDLKIIEKKLKTICGVGGSIKNGDIIIQGNYRNKIIELLKKENYNVKRVGG